MLAVKNNPLQRFPLNRPIEEDLGKWHVAHIKPRMEKALARDLADLEISYYLPMVEKRVRRSDNNKIRKSWIVLFPNYLSFAPDSVELIDRVYATGRVAAILPVISQDEFTSELLQIQRALNSGASVELLPAFKPGEKVRVKEGPLMGFTGSVIRNKGKTNLIIQVTMFEQAISVEVDEVYLESLR